MKLYVYEAANVTLFATRRLGEGFGLQLLHIRTQ